MNRRSALAKVIYTKTVKEYLTRLVDILFYNHYFSFEEFAMEYVRTLVQEMETTIHLKQKRKAPSHFARYGKDLYYVAYPKNKRTTWYFFFTWHPADDLYFIRYITNNHVHGQYLI